MNWKPCPFCGGTNLGTPIQVGIVVCGDCGAGGPAATPHPLKHKLTEIAAARKWNEMRFDRADGLRKAAKVCEAWYLGELTLPQNYNEKSGSLMDVVDELRRLAEQEQKENRQ